ncbi:hypothetical protein, partial [Bacteroides sp. 51]|uniref:hypothetical protein n=1 Tax=Bacteroides sp. 51 TaxID=2302938 RepID=UPI0019402809
MVTTFFDLLVNIATITSAIATTKRAIPIAEFLVVAFADRFWNIPALTMAFAILSAFFANLFTFVDRSAASYLTTFSAFFTTVHFYVLAGVMIATTWILVVLSL